MRRFSARIASLVVLPSASPVRCDEPEAVSFHHRTVKQRLVALEIGDPQTIRTIRGEVPFHEIRRDRSAFSAPTVVRTRRTRDTPRISNRRINRAVWSLPMS